MDNLDGFDEYRGYTYIGVAGSSSSSYGGGRASRNTNPNPLHNVLI